MISRVAVTIALTLAPAAFAQTYIVPDHDCGASTLHVTGADRIANAYLYLPKQRDAITPAAGSHPLAFDVVLPLDGVVMAAVNFQPEARGNETWTEHAKTMIFCSATAPQADWQGSADLGLEIFPHGWNGPRPNRKAGDTMKFIAVDKAPRKLLDVPMQLYRIGGGHVADGVPARDFGTNFQYPDPGWYMVTTTYRRPDPQQPQHWLVDTSTLTFEIK